MRALAANAATGAFWEALGGSGASILSSTLAACATGTLLGLLAARWEALASFLAPPIHLMKAAPIACVAVILLLIAGSEAATGIVVAIVALPPFYFAAREASENQPTELHELLTVYRAGHLRRFLAVTWPACLPFFQAAAKTAVAMAWKAGVTAELLSLRSLTIGEAIYRAKLSLDMANVLSWLIVIIALSWLCEKAAVALLGLTARTPKLAAALTQKPRGLQAKRAAASTRRQASGGTGNAEYPPLAGQAASAASCPKPQRLCITGPTGSGKTTLLRRAIGLPAEGTAPVEAAGIIQLEGIEGKGTGTEMRFGAVFQEPRLVEQLTPVENVLLTCGDASSPAECEALLSRVLPIQALKQPARELSGGMRRLTEIVRALACRPDAIILDEPFTGLDAATKQMAAELIIEQAAGTPLIMTTHIAGEPELLSAQVVPIASC